jgi:hypothetical protein
LTDTALEKIIDESYTADLSSCTTSEVRRKKADADVHEVALSYARRILQGKIDLLRAELASRHGDEREPVSDSVADIAQALEPRRDREFRGRFPGFLQRPETEEVRKAEEAASNPIFTRLEEASEDELAWLAGRLRDEERRISDLRNKLHAQIDALEAELVRRYASGEASVDEVLDRYVNNGT